MTEQEFDDLVEKYGYTEAIKRLPPSLDLDDIPGIEKHWLNNIKNMDFDYIDLYIDHISYLKIKKD